MSRFAALLDEFFYDPDEPVSPVLELPSTGDELERAPPEEPPGEYLAFYLEDECYGVAIADVREIVRVPPLTEVPRGAYNLLGVMNLRGEVLPVYDIKVRLRLSPVPPKVAGPEADPALLPRSARVLVLHGEEGDAGVLVDAVTEVVRLRPSQIEPPPPGMSERDCVLGLGRRKDQLCILLNVLQALSS
jgi:purine-binding chemotaxis protein CheW